MAKEEEITYPRWVQPDPNIGAILCRNAAEEAEVLSDHKSRQKPEKEAKK